jgi:hypothetical protein
MTPPQKRAPAKRRPNRSAAASGKLPKIDLAEVRAFVAAHLAHAQVAEKFGNASLSVAGKVFAFTRANSLVLKLPPDVIETTLASRDAELLVMGKRVMREWIVLYLDHPAACRDELALLRAAMSYVDKR